VGNPVLFLVRKFYLDNARGVLFMFPKVRIFPKVATLIFTLFMGLMLVVIAAAYSRRTGHTGLDMGKLQQLRRAAVETADN
jgi:hypothetical protein